MEQAATSLHYHGCPQCKTLILLRDFTDRLCFIKHAMECRQTESQSFQCFNCTCHFHTYKLFKDHFPSSGCIQSNNVCPLCQHFILADKESRNSEVDTFGCTQCNKSFKSASTFKLHQIAQHLKEGIQNKLLFDLECEQCKCSFETDMPFIYSNYYIFNRIICGDCVSHMETRMVMHPMDAIKGVRDNLQTAGSSEGAFTPLPRKSAAQLSLVTTTTDLPLAHKVARRVELEPFQNALEKYEQKIEDLFKLFQNSFKFKPTCLICPVQNEIRYESLKRLRYHYNKHHRVSKLFCFPKNLRCWDCYSTTKLGSRVRFNFSQISAHLKYHFEIQCAHCSLQFNCEKTLYKHFCNAHPDLAHSADCDSEDSNMCFICGDILPAGVHLEEHVLKHNEAVGPVVCQETPYKIMVTPLSRHAEKPKPYHKVSKSLVAKSIKKQQQYSIVTESSVSNSKRYEKVLDSPVLKDCEEPFLIKKKKMKPIMLKCSHCLKMVKEGHELIKHVQKHHPNVTVIKINQTKQIGNTSTSMPDI